MSELPPSPAPPAASAAAELAGPAARGPTALGELGLDRRSLVRLSLGLLTLLVVTAALGLLLRHPLSDLSRWFHGSFGLAGLFVGVLFTDTWVAPPLTHEPLLFFAHAAGESFVTIWAVAGTASVVAGPLGYAAGRLLGRFDAVHDLLARSQGLRPLMERRGAAVVAAAAITPIPFAVSTWLAGVVGIPFGSFFAACLVRLVKVGFYLGLIVLGWAAAG